ncbi:MAG TPA: amidohydrolase family protein [Gemmatimonadaceae bacterium]|nr:amidohydrolase family protein [Gemmatimonadaceae bacterium]
MHCTRTVTALLVAALLPSIAAAQRSRTTVDILITGGTVITMDSARRVIDDGAIAVRGDRILAVGTSTDLNARFTGRQVINARRKIVMPGLIDGHGHAGHGLVKSLGMDLDQFYPATEKLYAHGSTVDFWRADALLTGAERVRFGVTTALSFLGGGDMIMRTDDEKYGNAYLAAMQDVGLRFVLAVGPRRGPFPHEYTQWMADGTSRSAPVSFARHMTVSDALIRRWHRAAGGRISVAVAFPSHIPSQHLLSPAALEEMTAQARDARSLSRRHGVLFTQDGYTTGAVKFADGLGLLGPDALLSHATEFTDEEIAILARTGTRIVHNPSANAAITKRFQLLELLDAGVTVMLGSDGVAPDRSFDMFRHMFQAMHYHRFHYRDTKVLPPGKVLEMVTVDAARALGMEKDIGSLESGKKADVILIDWFQPHLVPMQMPLYRVAYFANGNDVTTVIVDGRVLMRDRRVLTLNVPRVLALAQRESEAAIRRSGLDSLLRTPDGFWGRSRYPWR